MKHLVIIGARGFGREVYDLACDCKESEGAFDIKGFLDDKADALDGYYGYPPVISSVEDYVVKDDDLFVCALGSPSYKQKYIEMVLQKGGRFTTLISPHAIVRRNAHIGIGCIVTAGSNISVDTKIGDYVSILSSSIGHDSTVGNYAVLSGSCRVNGFVQIGEMAYLACGVMVHPHKSIGAEAFCGIGSVVITNVKPKAKVFGNPAKKMDI